MRGALGGAMAMLASMLVACGGGGPNQLEGSLDEFYDLTFDHTRARLYSSQLAIEWVDEDAEVVARATVNITQVTLEGPATVDLAQYGDVSGTSGGRPIPDMDSGTLVLNKYAPEDGADVQGTLDASLVGERGNATLYGEFQTTLEDLR